MRKSTLNTTSMGTDSLHCSLATGENHGCLEHEARELWRFIFAFSWKRCSQRVRIQLIIRESKSWILKKICLTAKIVKALRSYLQLNCIQPLKLVWKEVKTRRALSCVSIECSKSCFLFYPPVYLKVLTEGHYSLIYVYMISTNVFTR